MEAQVSCCKNDGKAMWWLALLLSMPPFGMSDRCTGGEGGSAFPLLRGTEGPGVDELAMSMVGALLSHSLQQGKT